MAVENFGWLIAGTLAGSGRPAFSLADVAFAAACNSHGPTAIALNVSINFLTAVSPGARLYAVATEKSG